MNIDGVDIKSFGAILMDKIIQSASLEQVYSWNRNSIIPIHLDRKFTFNILEIKLYFKGVNEDDLKSKISAFINKAKECTIQFDDSFYYKGFLEGTPLSENTLKKETKKLTIRFLAYRFKAEVTEIMNRITSKTINVAGNLETPVIVEVTPSIDLIDLTINGLDEESIVLKNLKANKKIIVNGEDGTVLQEGVNKYSDTEMWSFPSLKPGVNTITVDKSSVDITIKYKPRYI